MGEEPFCNDADFIQVAKQMEYMRRGMPGSRNRFHLPMVQQTGVEKEYSLEIDRPRIRVIVMWM
jgi:hypothetical protein